MQETQIQSLAKDDPTCHGITKSQLHTTAEPTLQANKTLLKPVGLESTLHSKEATATKRKPVLSNEAQAQRKTREINK